MEDGDRCNETRGYVLNHNVGARVLLSQRLCFLLSLYWKDTYGAFQQIFWGNFFHCIYFHKWWRKANIAIGISDLECFKMFTSYSSLSPRAAHTILLLASLPKA